MPRLSVVLAVLCFPSFLYAQNIHPVPSPEVRAVPLQGRFQLDGRLDDPIWQIAPAATGLRQSQPLHTGDSVGLPATQRTEVRFAYDDAALYVGARMFDDSGAAGVSIAIGAGGGSLAGGALVGFDAAFFAATASAFFAAL